MSETTKHTPGDWYSYRHEHTGACANGECYRIDVRGNPMRNHAGKVVASEPICTLHAGFVHFEGNAALILAAPSLLAACERAKLFLAGIDRQLTSGQPPLDIEGAVVLGETLDQLRAAIAKAEGA